MSNRSEKIQRTVLPIPDRPHVGLTTYDARDPDTKYPPIEPLRPPENAPNVLIILIDDVGFGASSAFGGPCRTPNFERLAADGLRYNRFHSTALCYHACGASFGPQSSHRRDGFDHGAGDVCARAELTDDYSVRKFTGEVNWVEIDLGPDAADADHFIKPEERLHLAMAIQ